MDELILSMSDVRFRYPGAHVDAVAGVSLNVRKGELLGIVGPNGSGKTTMLRLLVGILRAHAGAVTVAGRTVEEWKRRELARIVGVVAQREEPVFPLRVSEAVFLGRYPHMGALRAPSAADRAAVASALQRCDVAELEDRWISTLSGGEWQRVRVARALAQEPQALLLDEPTASLDVKHEMEVFQLVHELVRRGGLAGVVITHHVNLAARFVDNVLVMNGGRVEAFGTPGDVMTRAVIERVFQWPVHIETWDGVPQFVPLKSIPSGAQEDE